jgi:hypothetical protein
VGHKSLDTSNWDLNAFLSSDLWPTLYFGRTANCRDVTTSFCVVLARHERADVLKDTLKITRYAYPYTTQIFTSCRSLLCKLLVSADIPHYTLSSDGCDDRLWEKQIVTCSVICPSTQYVQYVSRLLRLDNNLRRYENFLTSMFSHISAEVSMSVLFCLSFSSGLLLTEDLTDVNTINSELQ